ncbi:FAD-binding oxidoreductase [Nocardioides litoris]|uniref:FAD-binding oxidoreductase n=1 Tax=Nocardioides litoris TaxID=1926648 RepID=UPI00111F492D|nr:FAD-linked oxidase C-terminal domain-containing protein [Nocardioides litoris]
MSVEAAPRSSNDGGVGALAGLPEGVMIADPDVVVGYARDQSRFTEAGTPLAVLAPRSTAEVAACLRACHAAGVPVVTRGAGSGLSGGANAVDGGVVLSLHRMDAVLSIDPVERLAVVQPGVVTGDLRRAVAAHGLAYPPDPGSVDSCTVGGNVATNAGGMCCVKYGVTGDFVEALEVVLADGQVLRTGTRTVKGVAGYDLTRLLVGSEGTLGVVTEVTLRLVPAPPPPLALVATFARLADAGRAVVALVGAGLDLAAVELLDRTTLRAVDRHAGMGLGDAAAMLLLQADGPDATAVLAAAAAVCAEAGAEDVAVGDDPAESELLMAARRLALPALETLGDWLLDDVCVPRARVVELVEAVEAVGADLGLVIGVFGHAGDGNLHPTVVFDQHDPASRDAAATAFDRITAAALELGGTVTGEHGVGRLKAGWLARELDPVSARLQREVRRVFDPAGLLNPAVAPS